jgi:predicted DNA binding protein
MIEASLVIDMPDNWVKRIGAKFPAPIKFIECMPYGEVGGRGLIEIETDPLITDDIIREIRSHPDVYKVDVSNFGDGRISGSIVTNKCVACRALTGSDCFLTHARSLEEGKVEWKVTTSENSSLASLINKLKDFGCSVQINSITKLSSQDIVTKRQEEIVRSAYERGYYDYPRRTTIRDLAKIFGISPSTLGEILQRGERNIIDAFFSGKK